MRERGFGRQLEKSYLTPMHGDPVNLKIGVERIASFCQRVMDIPGLIIIVPHTIALSYVKQFKLSRIVFY